MRINKKTILITFSPRIRFTLCCPPVRAGGLTAFGSPHPPQKKKKKKIKVERLKFYEKL
jgi:hypothetical protein